jgi:Integral membrane protein EMC3/TMCO1-like
MLAGVFHTFTLFTLKASYDSVVLARLPFMPFSFITGITHRNLPGDDMRDAGILFIYALCSLAIKPNLQKLLGHEMPSEMQHAARRAEKLMESFGMKVDMPK